jgi:hypothetical protein
MRNAHPCGALGRPASLRNALRELRHQLDLGAHLRRACNAKVGIHVAAIPSSLP